jgi:MFS family permease
MAFGRKPRAASRPSTDGQSAARGGPRALEPWRRNLFSVTAASFIGFAGFTLVMPFLPLYFQELGVSDVGDIALWSGVSLGATPAVTAIMSPFWGRLADRYGRKIMVERSLVSFVVVMSAMAFVTRPWHVLALRALQGLFAGYGMLALTMAADCAPPGRLATAIGTVQTAQRLGPAVGPVIGGVLAGLVGLRHAFLVSAAFYACGLLLVAAGYRERAITPRATSGGEGQRVTFRSVLAFENLVLLMGVIFGLQVVDRSLGPILPLYVAEAGVATERVAFTSGLLFSLAALAGAVGNQACAWLLRRVPARAIIGGASAAGAVGALIFAVLPHAATLALASILFGLSLGTAMTAAYTAAGSVIPEDVRGTGFGVLTSATLVGLALSPMTSGLLGAISIRAVFLADAVALAVVAQVVWRLMAVRPSEPQQPSAEEI